MTKLLPVRTALVSLAAVLGAGCAASDRRLPPSTASMTAQGAARSATDYPNDSVDVYTYPGFTYQYSYDRGLDKNYRVNGIAQTR